MKLSVDECDELIRILRGVTSRLDFDDGILVTKLVRGLVSSKYIELPTEEEILNQSQET